MPLFKFAIGCELPSMERLARRKIARQEAQRNVEYLFNVSHPTTCVTNKTQTSPSNWQQQQMGHCHVQQQRAPMQYEQQPVLVRCVQGRRVFKFEKAGA